MEDTGWCYCLINADASELLPTLLSSHSANVNTVKKTNKILVSLWKLQLHGLTGRVYGLQSENAILKYQMAISKLDGAEELVSVSLSGGGGRKARLFLSCSFLTFPLSHKTEPLLFPLVLIVSFPSANTWFSGIIPIAIPNQLLLSYFFLFILKIQGLKKKKYIYRKKWNIFIHMPRGDSTWQIAKICIINIFLIYSMTHFLNHIT